MRQVFGEESVRLLYLTFLLSIQLSACAPTGQAETYRGDYTFGHEVNVFCAEINSQCYWLGPNSSQAARAKLKQIYEDSKPGLYKPACVVIDGVIDRDTPRDGFAADYDGLIDIESVLGSCDDSALITPGDLNHRRWVLAARNGVPVNDDAPPVVLDFGERLYVSGQDGCQRFSGFAAIEGNKLILDQADYDRSACTSGDLSLVLFSKNTSWQVGLVERGGLILEDGKTRLVFNRDDWR
jgi:heat shock protein HslJ